MFKKEQKPHKQMQHFDKPKKIKTSNTTELLITLVKRKKVVTMLMAMDLELQDKAKRKEEKDN
jgi:hypothetical protein